MIIEIIYCAPCWSWGKKRQAVAYYWDSNDNRRSVCMECLALIDKAGLDYELLNEDD